jgi:hypothetical protein
MHGGKAAASMVSSSCAQETDWAAAAATCPLVDSSKGWLVLHLYFRLPSSASGLAVVNRCPVLGTSGYMHVHTS